MFGDVEKIEKEILALEERLSRAKQQRRELNALDPTKRMAVFLHKKFCPFSHMDQCGWDYESGDNAWSGHAHGKWLKHAQEVMAAMEG